MIYYNYKVSPTCSIKRVHKVYEFYKKQCSEVHAEPSPQRASQCPQLGWKGKQSVKWYDTAIGSHPLKSINMESCCLGFLKLAFFSVLCRESIPLWELFEACTTEATRKKSVLLYHVIYVDRPTESTIIGFQRMNSFLAEGLPSFSISSKLDRLPSSWSITKGAYFNSFTYSYRMKSKLIFHWKNMTGKTTSKDIAIANHLKVKRMNNKGERLLSLITLYTLYLLISLKIFSRSILLLINLSLHTFSHTSLSTPHISLIIVFVSVNSWF